jgi:ribosome-associated protein
MTSEDLKNRIPESEFLVLTSRSSGPGGQNVNKVNTKVEIHFNVQLSSGLSVSEKELICKNLKNRINSAGELVIKSQSERTQLRNRKKAFEKLLFLLTVALIEKAERKPTAPSGKSKAERLNEKKKRSRIKKLRADGMKEYYDSTPP